MKRTGMGGPELGGGWDFFFRHGSGNRNWREKFLGARNEKLEERGDAVRVKEETLRVAGNGLRQEVSGGAGGWEGQEGAIQIGSSKAVLPTQLNLTQLSQTNPQLSSTQLISSHLNSRTHGNNKCDEP